MIIGERLEELRKDKGLSQTELAKTLGVKPNTISAYEREASSPSDEIKIKIAKLFNVSVDFETLKALAVIYNSSIDYMLGFSERTALFIDDLSPNKQEFMLDMLQQVRERFIDKETGE